MNDCLHAPQAVKRVPSLDALRGLAILTMVLAGAVAFGVLPSWMYHAQTPPPSHEFDPDLPGITWVDLVFPFFLFALGAAIPLALGKRLEQDPSQLKVLVHIFYRGFLLAFFAIFYEHVSPHVIDPDRGTAASLVGLLGFALLFAIFVRLPQSWKKSLRYVIRIFGWAGAVLLLAVLRYPDGSGFSLYRRDFIVVLLTNVYVFGALIWLLTRNNCLLRMGFLGILLALRLAHPEPGWVHWLWHASPIPWLYKMSHLQHLYITLPATAVGDVLVSWMKKRSAQTAEGEDEASRRFIILAIIVAAFPVVCVVGLQARWLWQTAAVSFILAAWGYGLVSRPVTETEKLLYRLFSWGSCFLVLGLLFEPYEGGIKKYQANVSWCFVSTALAIFLLIALTIVIEVFEKKRWPQILIDNGQNPMIAFVSMSVLISPIFALTSLADLVETLTAIPWLGFVRGLFYTSLVAGVVAMLTRHGIVWRT
jgi:predicted acyltransferase